jgi:hypothetical protein
MSIVIIGGNEAKRTNAKIALTHSDSGAALEDVLESYLR